MKETKKTLWVVVEVNRGVPATVTACDDYKIAKIRKKEIREGLNLNDDETGIFEIAV